MEWRQGRHVDQGLAGSSLMQLGKTGEPSASLAWLLAE